MARLMETPDGTQHTIWGLDDLLTLIGDYMGYEFKEAIVEEMNAIEDVHLEDDDCIREMNDQCGELWHKHREVMQEIDEEQKKLSGLLTAKELDRKSLSNVCCRIGGITMKELNHYC